MEKILTLDDILAMEHLTVHDTPIGEVSFMVPAWGEFPTMHKSYVSAHYRRAKDGSLIFVAGYSNKKFKKPDDIHLWHPSQDELGPHWNAQQLSAMEHNESMKHDPYVHKKDGSIQYTNGKPVKKTKKKIYDPEELTDQYVSFHFGDEVFVKYSHMHDEHYGIGAVVGAREDEYHGGKLIGVKFPHNKEVQYFAPESLAHVHRVEYEKRGAEGSTLEDKYGNPVPYQHMSPEQRNWFYDQYWLYNAVYHMSIEKAWKENKHEFLRSPEYMAANGLKTQYPLHAVLRFKNSQGNIVNESGMTLDELTKFEDILKKSDKYVPVVPVASIKAGIFSKHPETGEDYNKTTHYNNCKKLLAQIKAFEAEGIPVWKNKVYVPKSKKGMPKLDEHIVGTMDSPEYAKEVGGLYAKPVVLSNKEEIDPMDFLKLEGDMEEVVGHQLVTPSPFGEANINATEAHYGQPIIIHGQVKEAPLEGTKFPVAPVVAPIKESSTATMTVPVAPPKPKKEEAPKPKKEEGAKAAEPELVVPTAPEKKEEPEKKHVVHAPAEQKDISDLNFTFSANAQSLGWEGAHTKYIFKGSDGHDYLFKPFKDEEGQRVWAEIIPALLAESIGQPAAKFGSKPVTLNIPATAGGSYAGMTVSGSMQRIIPNVKKTHIRKWVENWVTCPKPIVEQLQREAVLDWLVGNHDPHAGQFIIDTQDNLIAIDKGQAFKFYDEDKLATDYNPNYDYEGTQLYNRMYEAAEEGLIQLDFGVVKSFIDHIKKNVSPLKWMNMVKPYAEQSHKWAGSVYKFQNLASARYANLESDFKKLYKSFGAATVLDEKGKKYKKEEEAPKKQFVTTEHVEPHAFMQLDHAFHAKVHEAGALGHSVLMGGGDVRDMDVTFTKYDWDTGAQKLDGSKKQGLEVAFELLQGAEQKIMPFFSAIEDQQTDYINEHGTLPMEHDPIAPLVGMAGKTINHHQADGQYNMSTLNQFSKWFQQTLDEEGSPAQFDANKPLISVGELAMKLQNGYITKKDYDDYVTMSKEVAQHYHKMAQEMLDAVKTKSKTLNKNYKPWEGAYKTKKQKVSSKKHPIATHPNFYLDQKTGKLMRAHGEKNTWMPSPGGFYGAESMKPYGAMLSKNLPGNIQIRYYPHYSQSLSYGGYDGQNNLRSQQGRFVIDFHSWDGDIDAMHKAREIMKEIGLDHRLSSHEDLEVMYLTRVAWQQKADVVHPSEWKKIAKMENDDKKIEKLKDLCAKVYGKHPDQLKTYDPVPKWDGNTTGNGTGGHHYWLNPYVLELIQSKPKKLMMPIHHLTASGSKTKPALECLTKIGLQSTEQRVKYVLPPGSSSSEDQLTGGAQSVFIKGSSTKYNDPEGLVKTVGYDHLVFKPELMARTDAYAFDHDNYGANYKTHFYGKNPISDRLAIMEYADGNKTYSITEIMFRNSIMFDSWLIGAMADYDSSWPMVLKEAIKQHKPHLLAKTHFISKHGNGN